MAENLDFQLVPYTPEEPDAANFVLLDGEVDPYPGFKVKVLREVTGTSGQPGTGFKTKLLREERGGVLINKILLEVVDGDNEPPQVTIDTITVTEVTETTVALSFNKAQDDLTPTPQLVYTCYQAGLPITTLSDIDLYGQVVSTATDVSTFTITGLNPGQQVFFNIVVEDLAGRRSAYGGGSELTLALSPVTVEFISEDTFLNIGQSTQLVWIINILDNLDDSVTFETSDAAIATVSSSGVVTGVAQGTATITVRSVVDTDAFDTLLVGVDTYEFGDPSAIQNFTTITE